eukprot:113929_1
MMRNVCDTHQIIGYNATLDRCNSRRSHIPTKDTTRDNCLTCIANDRRTVTYAHNNAFLIFHADNLLFILENENMSVVPMIDTLPHQFYSKDRYQWFMPSIHDRMYV